MSANDIIAVVFLNIVQTILMTDSMRMALDNDSLSDYMSLRVHAYLQIDYVKLTIPIRSLMLIQSLVK
jgi:hypothetical protein